MGKNAGHIQPRPGSAPSCARGEADISSSTAEQEPTEAADVQILCEVFALSLAEGAESSTLLVTSDVLHFEKTGAGLSVRVGLLDLHLQPDGAMEVKETPNGYAFLFPHTMDEVFMLKIYPRDGDADKVDAILALFGQSRPPPPEALPANDGAAYQSKAAGTILRSGVWLATKVVQAGDHASKRIEQMGQEQVQGRETKDVRVSEGTQRALGHTRAGAGHILRWTRVGVSLACATFKMVGGAMAEATRKTGALDRLTPDREGGRGTGRIVMEVGMASVDAALDVYGAIKKAADVVTDQTERTAVQVAGDLYGEEVREAAGKGVGAVMDVGRAGAKVFQVVGDEVDLCLQVATEYADHAITLGAVLAEAPLHEGQLRRRDPITFQWADRWASLNRYGLLLFRDEETLRARDVRRPPPNMVGADDLFSVVGAGPASFTVLSRDHVLHEFQAPSPGARDAWCEQLLAAQRNSHRYRVLEGAAGGAAAATDPGSNSRASAARKH